uniref:Uncharacterized protein n=1 Tax=Lepeophtheirus salmonis TaxID=72036 RepID=A0A0K2TTV1_LEPSM
MEVIHSNSAQSAPLSTPAIDGSKICAPNDTGTQYSKCNIG